MVRRRKKEIARQYFIYAIEFDSIVSPSDCFKFRLSTPQPNEPFFQMTFGWKSQREKKTLNKSQAFAVSIYVLY